MEYIKEIVNIKSISLASQNILISQSAIVSHYRYWKKVDEIKEEAKSINSYYKGELKIAATPSLIMTLLPHTLSLLKKDFPKIKVTIIETDANSTMEKVNSYTFYHFLHEK